MCNAVQRLAAREILLVEAKESRGRRCGGAVEQRDHQSKTAVRAPPAAQKGSVPPHNPEGGDYLPNRALCAGAACCAWQCSELNAQ